MSHLLIVQSSFCLMDTQIHFTQLIDPHSLNLSSVLETGLYHKAQCGVCDII